MPLVFFYVLYNNPVDSKNRIQEAGSVIKPTKPIFFTHFRTPTIFLLLMTTLLNFALATPASAVDYHVDSDQGQDTNTGISAGAAWQTLDKVNATTFQPGDRILLKAGSKWSGALKPQGSGAKGAPVTITSYGEGAKPLIDGAGAEAAISLENQQHWAIEKLELRNTVTGDRMMDGFLSAKHKQEGKGTKVPGLRSGITVKAKMSTERMAGLRIADCVFTKIDGSSWQLAQPGMYANAAIHVETDATFDDVTIENNHIHDIGTIGIIAWVGTGGLTHKWLEIDPALWGKKLLVRNNRIERTGADGIIVGCSIGALVEGNICFDAGINANAQPVVTGNPKDDAMHIAGIWVDASRDAVLQFNECARVKAFDIPADSNAWDVDMANRGTITYQYNYSHDNPAGTILLMNHNPNLERVIFRYNVSINDGTANKFGRQIAQVLPLPNTKIEISNNLFINTANKDGYRPSQFPGVVYRNNVFSFAAHEAGPATYPSGPIFEANAYVGHTPIVKDELKVVADPLFVNPGAAGDGIKILKAFQVQAGSPLVGAGAVSPDPAAKDFFGNPVPAKPSIGIHEPSKP